MTVWRGFKNVVVRKINMCLRILRIKKVFNNNVSYIIICMRTIFRFRINKVLLKVHRTFPSEEKSLYHELNLMRLILHFSYF